MLYAILGSMIGILLVFLLIILTGAAQIAKERDELKIEVEKCKSYANRLAERSNQNE